MLHVAASRRREGFCANAIAVAPPAGPDSEMILRADTPRGIHDAREMRRSCTGLRARRRRANGETLKLDGGFSLTRKSRPAPSAEVAEWLVEPEWRLS
jgi:hypothetical protein